ncbi:sensor histidine kinase [Clostridium brassicae]|uniref:histidine kinase n=1 Tax=Clostridium brassicae TaxID=2999072 RepID=A0ABT4D6D4_9CLOT|nr:Spo0B domain-containing protein [Clostridium brassicae]MCY6957243.1 Spo0B domain-containing protein [Clostridium brassicae]
MKKRLNKNLNINKTIITIVMLNIIQLGSIIAIVLFKYSIKKQLVKEENFKINIFIYLILSIVILNGFIIVRDFYLLNKHNYRYDMMKKSLEQVENLNKTLRAQRHDFMNHLQVVYSLMELEEYNEAQGYIDKVFKDIQKVNKALKTLNPAVNALLQAKLLYAEKRGINMEIVVTSQLKGLKIPSWEFCRVLGNMIDNSIFALHEKDKNRLLQVELYEDVKMYRFRIKNNGPEIPKDIRSKLFDVGFTTKGERGEGMGLAIVKQIITNYGGDIYLQSDENVTVFEGWIKK